MKYRLALDGLKLRDVDSGFLSRSIKFALFSTESRCIYCSVGWLGSLVVRALDLQLHGVCVRPSERQQNCAPCEPAFGPIPFPELTSYKAAQLGFCFLNVFCVTDSLGLVVHICFYCVKGCSHLVMILE